MDKLPDGSLAVFFEDESNGVDNWTMNFITLTREQVEAMMEKVDTTTTLEERQHAAAMQRLKSGGLYSISATRDGKTCYLANDGTITTDANSAGLFTVGTVIGGDIVRDGIRVFSPNAYYSFTNPDWSNGKIVNHDAIRPQLFTKNDRVNFDAQVLYFDGNRYAVRATNASGSDWGAASFWTVTASGKAAYTDTERPYIWNFNLLMDAPVFDETKAYELHSCTGDKYFSTGTNQAIALDVKSAAATYSFRPCSEYNTVQNNLFYVRDNATGLYVMPPLNGSSDKPWTLSATPTPVMVNVAGTVTGTAGAREYYISSLKRDVASFVNGAKVVNRQPANTTYVMRDDTAKWFITLSDKATGINSLTRERTVDGSSAYSLGGRRVSKTYKGIVVTHVRKVLRR